MDSKLLPIYKKALNNDPQAILNFGKLLQAGEGIALDVNKAAEWYEKLLEFPQPLPFIDYALLHYWGAIAAWNRKETLTALERLKTSYRLFVDQYPDPDELNQQLKAHNFHAWYGYMAIHHEFND